MKKIISTKTLIKKQNHDVIEDKPTFKRIAEHYYFRTKLDNAFQRNGGWERGSGWTIKQHRKYLDSAYANCSSNPSMSNPIILVNIRECLRVCYTKSDIKEYKDSIPYFEKCLEEGYEFISIDGNNSTSTIVNFIKGVDPDILTLSDGRSFNQLSEEERDDFLRGRFNVHIIRNMNLEQMCEHFRNLNSQSSLNPQENRQSRISDLATFIRATANEFHSPKDENGINSDNYFYNLVFSKSESLDMRKHEELMATLCYMIYHSFSKDANQTSLDQMYENIKEFDQITKDNVSFIHSELRKVGLATKRRKNQIKQGKLIFFGILLLDIKDSGFKVKNHGSLFDKFLEKDADWIKQSEIMKKTKSLEYYEENAWDYMCQHFRVPKNFKRGMLKLLDWFENQHQQLIDEDIVAKVRKNETFSFADKLMLYALQDGKDRNGNEIPISSVYNGEVHADHVQSVKNGGKTEISNAELMFAKDNLEKGSQNNEPYFDHQIKEQNETNQAAE